MSAIAIPICTALAIGGDALSNYIDAHFVEPATRTFARAPSHALPAPPSSLAQSRTAGGLEPVNIELVTDAGALAALCERIAVAPRIGLDTEFHTEKHFTPKLMVVQLAFDDAVAIVDPLALADLRPLAAAFTQATVVGHALSSDLRILEDAFGVLPREAYDTQVAAAFCGYGMSISLLDLVRDVARRHVAQIADGQRLEHAAVHATANRLSRRRRTVPV